MGEIADMMLDGTLCSETGVYLGPGPGYPRTAKSFARDPMAYAYEDEGSSPRKPKGRMGKATKRRFLDIYRAHCQGKKRFDLVPTGSFYSLRNRQLIHKVAEIGSRERYELTDLGLRTAKRMFSVGGDGQ
ncbi:MAG: hypothetical protein AAF940_03745 [Pseudomonadota bacterium]